MNERQQPALRATISWATWLHKPARPGRQRGRAQAGPHGPLTALARPSASWTPASRRGVLSVLTGPGGTLGDALVADPHVRRISITVSTATGERIVRAAGVKKSSSG
jgi:hypothetical protein